MREPKIIEWEGRKITLYPMAKTAQFSIINSIAHIIAELAKKDIDILGALKEIEKKAGSEDSAFSWGKVLQALPMVAEHIEGDIDNIIDKSTPDISLQELQAGKNDVAQDFDDDLYWDLVEEILVLNKGKWIKWIMRAGTLMEKLTLALGTEEEEGKEKTAENQPETKPEVMAGASNGESSTP